MDGRDSFHLLPAAEIVSLAKAGENADADSHGLHGREVADELKPAQPYHALWQCGGCLRRVRLVQGGALGADHRAVEAGAGLGSALLGLEVHVDDSEAL